MKSRKSRIPSFITLLLHALIVTVGLTILWFFKYDNQGLSLRVFSLHQPGNILNLAFAAGLLVGLLLLFLRDKKEFQNQSRFFFLIEFGAILSLFAGKTISALPLFTSGYFLGESLQKVFSGLMYIVYTLLTLFQAIYILQLDFKLKKLLIFKGIVNSIFVVVVLYIFIYVFGYVFAPRQTKENGTNYDTGVVLGSAVWSKNKPSPNFRQRIEKAAEMYKAGRLRTIYLTGSNAPGEMTEADVAYNYLKTMNIPLNDVLVERQTTSTAEQIRFVRSSLLNGKRFRKVAVITDPIHSKRVEEICNFYNLKVDVIHSEGESSFGGAPRYKFRESVALLIFWLFGL